ncbi:hypothetical protein [Risungbinella massiliensis]|uniref:hypothetical protein n=1 Tax=Risungbinella massiliensis TaxID=1329796 RepID=UPI0005CBD5ED|nr:hypothetical protein [Risungbinella massiliensis]
MIRLLIEGDQTQIENFIRSFENLTNYQTYSKSILTNKDNFSDVRFSCYIRSRHLPKKHNLTNISLTCANGEQFQINLTDCQIVQIEPDKTIICGKNYDIFA